MDGYEDIIVRQQAMNELRDVQGDFFIRLRQLDLAQENLDLRSGNIVEQQKALEAAVLAGHIAKENFELRRDELNKSKYGLEQALVKLAETQDPFVRESIIDAVHFGYLLTAHQFAVNPETHIKSDGYQRLCIMLDSSGSSHKFYDDMLRSARVVFSRACPEEVAAVNIGTQIIVSDWTTNKWNRCLSEVLDIRQRWSNVDASELEALLGKPFGAILVTDGDFYNPDTARQAFMRIAGPETQNQLGVMILPTEYSRFTSEQVAQNFDFANCYFVRNVKQLEEIMVSYALYLCAGHCKPLPMKIQIPAAVMSV